MKEITVPANISNLPKVQEFIEGELIDHNCSVKVQTDVAIIIDEIFSNIANYAYETNEGMATVSFALEDTPKVVKLVFSDSGLPFDPLAKDDPDTSLSADERRIGGLGIFLVRKLSNEIKYECVDGKNVLSIIKSIE